jgi:two-component system alkaline phosphatase synthesis response regulator PhoP
MPKETILVIEDDLDIVEIIQYNFEREGYLVITASNGEKGLDLAKSRRPALVILDLMLPGLDGIEVCKRLRGGPETRSIPIVMLTAKGEESDIVLGLGVGADDYVTKPFSPKELLARITAVLRRGDLKEDVPAAARIQRGPIVIDPARFEVEVRKKPVSFTLTEFKILSILAANPGRVYTRQLLLDKIQGGDAYVDDRNIDVHIRSIRRKLEDLADAIITVRGVGYKFRE